MNLPQRLLLLMDHSLDFVEFLGRGGTIEGVSAAITFLGGYHPDELVGRPYQEIVHPEDWASTAAAFAELLEGKNPGPITLRYRHKNGSWRTIQATGRNFLADPAVRAIIVLTRDITDQMEAEVSLAQAHTELQRLSQQLIVAREKERHHIALELHDDVQQILVGLRMQMDASLRSHPAGPPTHLVAGWIQLVRDAVAHLHDLTRELFEPVVGKRGLAVELRDYVDRLTLAEGQEVQLTVDAGLGTLAPDIELACYRIVQEGLANALAHGAAKHLHVSLTRSNDELAVSIQDDGIGFDKAAVRARSSEAGNIGLLSMRERAALAGGKLEIRSSVGHGTSVRAAFEVG